MDERFHNLWMLNDTEKVNIPKIVSKEKIIQEKDPEGQLKALVDLLLFAAMWSNPPE